MVSRTRGEAGTTGQFDGATSLETSCPRLELTSATEKDRGEASDALLFTPAHNKGVATQRRDEETADASTRTTTKPGKLYIPKRYVLALMGFWAFFDIHCLRTCINVAMVAMVNATALAANRRHRHQQQQQQSSDSDSGLLHVYHNGDISSNSNNSNNNNNGSSFYYTGYVDYSMVSSGGGRPPCAGEWDDVSNATTDFVEGELVWDERTQGLVLGAFYYGYVLPQVAGGWLADRWRGKRLLGGALLASSLLSLVIPTAARAGPPWVIAVRALQGVVESSCYPAMHALLAAWTPPQERSKLVAFTFTGNELGVVVGMLMTGVLCRYGFAGGWPSAFYVFGMSGCVWFLLWTVLAFDSPARHPRISDSERRYIQQALGTGQKVKGHGVMPWRAMLTSGPVWALCAAHIGYCWGYYSLLITLPTFLKHIHHFHIVSNGFLSALPYLLMSLVCVCAGLACDYLRRYLPLLTVRKIMHALGCALPACFLVSTGYVQCDHALAVTLVVIGGSCKGMAATTALINHLDIAPKFAGVLFGLTNTLANISGFVAPALVGYLTYENQTIGQWRKFFYITAAIYVVSVLIFLVLGKADCQPWARPEPTCLHVPEPSLEQLQQQEKQEDEDEDEEKGTKTGDEEGEEEEEKEKRERGCEEKEL